MQGFSQFLKESTIADKREEVGKLVDSWVNQNVNEIPPDELLLRIAEFAKRLDLKTIDDLVSAMNPNIGYLTPEQFKVINNIIATAEQRLGKEDFKKQLIAMLTV